MFPLWAGAVFAVFSLGYNFFTKDVKHPESLSMSPGHALIVMAVTFGLGAFYVSLFLRRYESETRLSAEGLRTSLMRFHKWTEIDHVSRHGDLYVVYHRVNPVLPAAVLKVANEEKRALLEKALSENQIRVFNEVHFQFTIMKAGAAGGFIAVLLGSYWLHAHSTISDLWIAVIAFGAGIVLVLPIEYVRGCSKYGKYKPISRFEKEAWLQAGEDFLDSKQ